MNKARNDARSDSVWSKIVSATKANDVTDDPELSRPQKIFPSALMNLQMSSFVQRSWKYVQYSYIFEVLDSIISGLSNRFEPDATAVRLTSIENHLIGKRKDFDYIARPYKDL